MRNKVQQAIATQIRRLPAGSVFTPKDLLLHGNRAAVDQALHRLCKSGKIRRVARGLYDKPKYSTYLQTTLRPDVRQAAAVIARKHGWAIYPTGAQALNQLGLSTQVPARYVFLSPDVRGSRVYDVNGTPVEFRHVPAGDVSFTHPESRLLVTALKSLGRGSMDPDTALRLHQAVLRDKTERQKVQILKETRTAPAWVYDEIKQVVAAR